MNQLVEANTINNQVKQEDSTTCLDGKMIELDEEKERTVLETPCPKDAMTNEEEERMKPTTTPWTEIGYNNASIHLEKLDVLGMFDKKTYNIVDIQKK